MRKNSDHGSKNYPSEFALSKQQKQWLQQHNSIKKIRWYFFQIYQRLQTSSPFYFRFSVKFVQNLRNIFESNIYIPLKIFISPFQKSAIGASTNKCAYEIAFVTTRKSADKYKEAVFALIAQSFRNKYYTHYSRLSHQLARAEYYLFDDCYGLLRLYALNAHIADKKICLMFRKIPHFNPILKFTFLRVLRRCFRVVVPNPVIYDWCIRHGLLASGIVLWPGACDSILFSSHKRNNKRVAILGSSPIAFVLEKIQKLTAAQSFVWEDLNHLDLRYGEYADILSTIDILINFENKADGPWQLWAAMASNVIPISVRNEYTEQIIRHGENGYLFDESMPSDQISQALLEAISNETDVRQSVLQYDWRAFAIQVFGTNDARLIVQSSPSAEYAHTAN